MKVLVTGATGFVGAHLVRHLTAAGADITALVRSAQRGRPLAHAGVRLVVGDLDDHAALAEAVAGQDLIHHVAALTGAPDENTLWHANRAGTAHLIAAAEAAGVARMVLMSSAAAGGPSTRDRPKDDAGQDQPVTGYGRSKLAAEEELRSSRLAWTILRPPAVYGPGDRTNFLSIFRAAARWGVVPVFGDGSQQLSLIHVGDLAAAAVCAGKAAGLIGATCYVNHPEIVTSRDVVTTIASAVGRRVRVVPLPAVVTRSALWFTGGWARLTGRATILHPDKVHEFVQPAWTGDPRRFIAATGWTPQFDLSSGMRDTAAWYRAERLL